jgi:hypothetical protein
MNSARKSAASAHRSKPIEEAAAKAGQVQQDLAVAEAELHLTNTVIGRTLPEVSRQGDLKKAVDQNSAIEDKVGDAAEELQEVTELLEAEACERERLERELERRDTA